MCLLRRGSVFLVLAGALLASGCVLLFEDGGFQSITFHFTIDQEIAADEPFDVETLVHPVAIGTRRLWVQVSGMLMAPEGEELPDNVRLTAVTLDENDRRTDRFRKTLRIRDDGGFKESKRIRRDIPAGALQNITIEPRGVSIPQGTKIWLCIDIVESRRDLRSLVDCSMADDSGDPDLEPDGDTVVIEVRDFDFSPQRRRINPGDTVRWTFAGNNQAHTVTAENPNDFDSGFAFNAPGDFFEVEFGQETDGQTFLYYCRTHQASYSMQGSILVGDQAADPPDGY